MKKIVSLFSILIVGMILTSGCGSPKDEGVSGEDAGKIVIDAILYQKNTEKIDDVFSNSEEIKETIGTFFEELKQGMLEGALFDAEEVEDNAEDIQYFYDLLVNQVKKEVTYELEQKSKNKNSVTLEVKVKGLDFESLMGNLLSDMMKESQSNPEIMEDENQAMTFVMNLLRENIEKLSAVEEPVVCELTLKKVNNKWTLGKMGRLELQTIYVVSLLGTDNPYSFLE